MHHSILTCCPSRGLTLIEVVAGLALMGTLLAAMLSAKSDFASQHHYAQRVLIAVDAMDELLMNHWQDIKQLEDLGAGNFNQHKDLTWTAKPIDDPNATDWYCRILRVQVLDTTAGPNDPPLASVDLLIPEAPPQEALTEPSPLTDDHQGEPREDNLETPLETPLETATPQLGEFP